MASRLPSSLGRPSKGPELTIVPSSGVGLLQRLAVPVRRRDDHGDRQAVLLGEVEVALVVAGHAHDGARCRRPCRT